MVFVKFVYILLVFPLTAGVINVLLRQLAMKQQGEYVSPRVIQGIFNYFIEAWVGLSVYWYVYASVWLDVGNPVLLSSWNQFNNLASYWWNNNDLTAATKKYIPLLGSYRL